MLNSDIALIVPVGKSHYVVPPVGLGYLATALRRAGFNSVTIIDSIRENLSIPQLVDKLVSLNPRIIGFQVFSSDFVSVRDSINLIKQKIPGAMIILGGPHVSATGTSIFSDFPGVDFGFMGESEVSLPLFARRSILKEAIELESIPGLVHRSEGVERANERAYIEDLDALGFPAWDLMPPDKYPDAPQGAFYRQFPIAPIATTRGCPYTCAFCGSPVNMGNKLRFRSLDSVFGEMETLYKHYGVREFHFIDDMFNMSRTRVLEFCRILDSRKWGINYTFPNGLRLNTIDRETLAWMKKTGAYAFTVGIESGSQRILDAMNKKLTVDMIREKVQMIAESGIEPSGFFLLGYPGETKEDIRKTIDFAKSLPLKRAHFSNFLPLPGTLATQRLLDSGEIGPPDWENLAYSNTPYAPKGISTSELKSFQRRAFLEFHLRPKILFKMLTEIKSPHHFKSLLVRAKDYLLS